MALKTLAREQDRIEILRRLRGVHPGSVRRWGRMSAHQMVCHLADSFRILTGERPVVDRSNLFRRTLLRRLVLYGPLRWPPGIPTSAEADAERGGTCPVEFTLDLATLEGLFEVATRQTKGLDGQAHPIFGRMSETDWLRWGYLHMDHHLRQFSL